MNRLIADFTKKAGIFCDSVLGECVKAFLRLKGLECSGSGINDDAPRKERVIVSLTSYGRRVESVLPFTIYSLLHQQMKPDMIILWLDKDNWNEGNLPHKLRILQQAGLSVRFCDDLRSYKKHVPALEAFPDDIIITVDDDFYYSSDFIGRLIEAYHKDSTKIYTYTAHRPTFDGDGRLKPYNDWQKLVHDTDESPVFATTGGGCLFRRNLLHDDATKVELFTKLCPMADDVWFYFMGVLKGTRTAVLPFSRNAMIPIDNFFQLTHKGANLSCVNYKESYNDTQIRNVMEHYGITPADLVLR